MSAGAHVAEVLRRLDGVRAAGDGWMARCPGHEDKQASLSLSIGNDERVLLKCHAGCTGAAVLGALGLNWKDMWPRVERGNGNGRNHDPAASVRVYAARGADGELVAEHVREDGPAGKRMWWRRPGGEKGLGGLRCADLPLYGAELLRDRPLDPVVVVEGEKAADAARKLGLLALGTVTGASSCPSPGPLSVLRGRAVVCWPDADEPGRGHMRKVQRGLAGVATSVRFSEWAEAPPGGDADDYLAAGHAADDALMLLGLHSDSPEAEREDAAEGPQSRIVAYTFDELRSVKLPVRPALICRGQSAVFRRGTIAEVFAYRGVGKTWFAHTLALVAAAGAEAFGWHAPEPCNVLLVDGEMPGDLVRDRLQLLAGWLGIESCPRLVVVGADWQPDYLARIDTAEGQAAIEPLVEPADLVIFDNRSCLLDVEGEKDPAAWQPAQDYVLKLRRRGKATTLVHHANRAGGARGLGKAEDVMDVVLKLSQPEGYTPAQGARFVVAFDKARGLYGEAVAPFVASLTETGWRVESAEAAERSGTERKIRDYLRAAGEIGERPTSANATIRGAGVQRAAGLEAFGRMLKAGEIVKHDEGGYHLA